MVGSLVSSEFSLEHVWAEFFAGLELMDGLHQHAITHGLECLHWFCQRHRHVELARDGVSDRLAHRSKARGVR